MKVPDGLSAPPPDDVSAPWWAATEERTLLVQECAECGSVQHPPRALCVSCGCLDRLGWRTASGRARVDSWTVVHRSPRPDAELPYVIARVRLAEGPVLLTRLVKGDPEAWGIGDDVVLDWHPLTDGRALPVFGPLLPVDAG
jgi:uncharacterized OB-fold protein